MSTSPNTGTDLVSAYLDDELEPADAQAFESLLDSSPAVQEELADLQKVISLVSGLGDVEAPEDFYEKLNRRIRRRQIMQPQTGSKLAMKNGAKIIRPLLVCSCIAMAVKLLFDPANPVRIMLAL